MRLKPEKIELLASLVFESLEGREGIKMTLPREDVIRAIGGIITEDLKAEDEIEAEAREILEAHEAEFKRTGASRHEVLRKTIGKLARDRKMVI